MRGDRRGPEGRGPRTGRQLGRCSGYGQGGFENKEKPRMGLRRRGRAMDAQEGAAVEVAEVADSLQSPLRGAGRGLGRIHGRGRGRGLGRGRDL